MKNIIILLNTIPSYFIPIKDRIEFEKISDNVEFAMNCEEACLLIQNSDECIVVTDSIIANHNKNYNCNIENSAKYFLEKVLHINPNCQIILYATNFFEIDLKKFNYCINSVYEKSYNELFEKLIEFTISFQKNK